MVSFKRFFLFIFVLLLCAPQVFAQGDELLLFQDITMVTSAIGREQKLSEVPNALYVISREDIDRSGAKCLPELFYKVPGMQVRRIDGNRFFVAVRDIPVIGTNNLLVLLDGAVVYNPIFGGGR